LNEMSRWGCLYTSGNIIKILSTVMLILFTCCIPYAFANDTVLAAAYKNHKSDFQIQGRGFVIKQLADDNKGSRHQRILIRLASGQTLLIAHNIDLAPRVKALKEQDVIEFYGEYEWNKKGGVVHWTHRDPKNNHAHGWLRHQGKTYQ